MAILYDPQNVVVGQAAGYFGAVGATPPDDTVAAFGDWGSDWAAPGATEEGYKLGGETSTTPHNIEEQPNPALMTLDQRNLTISAALAEDTLESMRLSFGGGTITTAVGTGGAPTIKTFQLSEFVDEFAFGLDMSTYPVDVGGVMYKVTRRIIIPRVSGSGTVDVAFRRAAAKRMWPLQMTQLCKPSEVIIKDIIPTA